MPPWSFCGSAVSCLSDGSVLRSWDAIDFFRCSFPDLVGCVLREHFASDCCRHRWEYFGNRSDFCWRRRAAVSTCGTFRGLKMAQIEMIWKLVVKKYDERRWNTSRFIPELQGMDKRLNSGATFCRFDLDEIGSIESLCWRSIWSLFAGGNVQSDFAVSNFTPRFDILSVYLYSCADLWMTWFEECSIWRYKASCMKPLLFFYSMYIREFNLLGPKWW